MAPLTRCGGVGDGGSSRVNRLTMSVSIADAMGVWDGFRRADFWASSKPCFACRFGEPVRWRGLPRHGSGGCMGQRRSLVVRLAERPGVVRAGLDLQPEEWPQADASGIADERCRKPKPAMGTAGGDATEERADVAAIGDAGTVAEQ